MVVNISRAKRIRGGGTTAAELEWLAEHAKPRLRIVELGTYRGRSARAMLDSSKAHIWCVDRWSGPAGKVVVSENDYQIFLTNIVDIKDRVTVLKMTTQKALEHFLSGTFDMIFVDADHSYESAKFDIIHYAPLLKPGGLLCGHDYNPKRWPGVVRAVKELVRQAHVVHTIWWVKRPLTGDANWLTSGVR